MNLKPKTPSLTNGATVNVSHCKVAADPVFTALLAR